MTNKFNLESNKTLTSEMKLLVLKNDILFIWLMFYGEFRISVSRTLYDTVLRAEYF